MLTGLLCVNYSFEVVLLLGGAMKKREVGIVELDELVALFDSCDAFGRHFILEAARNQALASGCTSTPSLSLVLPQPSLDHKPDGFDSIVDRRPLTLVR